MQRCRKKQNLGRRWIKKKKDSLVIVNILEVAAYSNRQQAQVWRGTRWKYFKLHLVDLNWFSDRSKFKALDHSVAFDMKGYEDSEDRRSLILVSYKFLSNEGTNNSIALNKKSNWMGIKG